MELVVERQEGAALASPLTVEQFLADGFALRPQLAAFLEIALPELERRLPSSTNDLAALHPGAFDPNQVEQFYHDLVHGLAAKVEKVVWA